MKLVKKLVVSLLLLIFCIPLFSSLALALPSDTWFANYGNRNGSLSVFTSGNGLGDNNELRLVTTEPKNGQIFYTLQGVALYAPNNVSDKNNVANQCTINLTVVVSGSNPSSGTFYVAAGAPLLGGSNNQSCNSTVLNEAKAKFDQKNLSIGQLATFNSLIGQGGGSLPQTKTVTVTSVPLVAADAGQEVDTSIIPQQDTLTIKNASGAVVASKSVNATILTGNTVSSSTSATVSVYYQTTLDNIAAGSYQACSGVLKKCEAFVKSDNQTASVRIEGDESTKLLVGQASTSDDDSCETKAGRIGWLMCPIVTAIDESLEWVDEQIASLLSIDPTAYTNDRLHQAWSQIRNIALIILVPIMLVMVISTALGFEAFDAYTVRRALPRFFIAIIFITLSWEICTYLITLSNLIGEAIMGILTFPFAHAADVPVNQLTLSRLYGGSSLQFVLTPVAVVGGALLLWFFAGTLLLFAAVAFIVLVLRQIFIIALLLAAPLAILAWIFPGNDRLWKAWWSMFSKLLLMFPMIMGLLAIGRIFAIIVHEGGTGDSGFNNILQPIIILIAWTIPYALIPFTFRFAGGVFATITGGVQNFGKGAGGIWKGVRTKPFKSFHEKTTAGTGRFGKSESKIGSTYRRAASFGRHGSLSPFGKGRSRWSDWQKQQLDAKSNEMIEQGGARGLNDDDATGLLNQRGMTRNKFLEDYAKIMEDQGRGRDDTERKRMAEDALSRAEQAVGARVGSDAMVVAAQKFRTAMTNTAYAPGTEGLQAMQDDLVRLQEQGLITAVDAASWMKSNRGRADYSANGFVETVNFAAGTSTASKQLEGAFKGADPREMLGSHQRGVESFAEQAKINLQTALAGDDEEAKKRALADVAGIYDQLSQVSRKKADVWAYGSEITNEDGTKTKIPGVLNMDAGTIVETVPVIGPDGRRTGQTTQHTVAVNVQQYIERLRGDDEFTLRRREYASDVQRRQGGQPPDPNATGGNPGP